MQVASLYLGVRILAGAAGEPCYKGQCKDMQGRVCDAQSVTQTLIACQYAGC